MHGKFLLALIGAVLWFSATLACVNQVTIQSPASPAVDAAIEAAPASLLPPPTATLPPTDPQPPTPTPIPTTSPALAPTAAATPPAPPSHTPMPMHDKDQGGATPSKASPLRDTILCYYGNRAARSMGVLGQLPLEQLVAKLRELGRVYDELNGEQGVTLCFDYIYLVANVSAHPYAHNTPRMDLFEEALQFAEEQGILFFVDLQLGYRTIDEEIPQVLPYLLKPNVHLAVDTEFYMHRRGGVPGDTLGSMDAADVNKVQEMMQRFITENHLPDKILEVYQFDPIMLTNKDQLNLDLPNVHLLITADGVGYGGVGGKVHDYQEYASEPRNALGIKLFLGWDAPLLQPYEVMALDPPPNEIVYQ